MAEPEPERAAGGEAAGPAASWRAWRARLGAASRGEQAAACQPIRPHSSSNKVAVVADGDGQFAVIKRRSGGEALREEICCHVLEELGLASAGPSPPPPPPQPAAGAPVGQVTAPPSRRAPCA